MIRILYRLLVIIGLLTSTQICALDANGLLQRLAMAESGQFIQTRFIEGAHFPLTSKGTFELIDGISLIWKTHSPVHSKIEISETGVTNENGEKLKGSHVVGEILLSIFNGNPSQLEQFFTIDLGSNNKASGKSRVFLTPASSALANTIVRIELFIEDGLRSLTVYETSGSRVEINLRPSTEILPNDTVSPNN